MSTVDLSGRRWRKSSYSGGAGNGGDCVEVAFDGATGAVRDSKNCVGPVLVLPAAHWLAMLATLPNRAG